MGGMKSTRRQMVAGLVGGGAALCCGDHVLNLSVVAAEPTGEAPKVERSGLRTVRVADELTIHPRSEWGADLAPKAPMGREDVRFLLVHHTATDFGTAAPRTAIRSIYGFHTGPDKGWPDVVYNFFVAPDGSVWEGRAGSLDGPVVADATGGNQGFAQLVCLIGNYVSTPPTAAAQASLVRVLAWLAGRYDLNTYRDASTTFVSRGSNKFPRGATITTPIISPHRAVTFTTCPGDAAVTLLPEWRRRVYDTLSATWATDGLQPARRTRLSPP